jgi:hypothetical protein
MLKGFQCFDQQFSFNLQVHDCESSYIDFTVGSVVFSNFSSSVQDIVIKILWIPVPPMIFCLSSYCFATNYSGTSKFHWQYSEYTSILVSYDYNSSVIYSPRFKIRRKSPQNLVSRRLGGSQILLGSPGVERSSDPANAEKLLISPTWLWGFTTWPIFTTRSQHPWTSSCLIIRSAEMGCFPFCCTHLV